MRDIDKCSWNGGRSRANAMIIAFEDRTTGRLRKHHLVKGRAGIPYDMDVSIRFCGVLVRGRLPVVITGVILVPVDRSDPAANSIWQ